MKKVFIASSALLLFTACGGSQAVVQNNAANNPNARGGNQTSVVSHSTDPKMPPASGPANGSAPASGGNSPMARAIDVSSMTATIEKAEKAHKDKPSDEKAKTNLADAYFERALALTNAAQYRAAIGDYRKGLKLNPDDKEAKEMYDRIIGIFKSVNREPPKEGEEPAPMPFAANTAAPANK